MTIQSKPIKVMLINNDNTCIIKIWEHENIDVDIDGTKYHRGLILKKCGCDTPIKVKIDEYDMFLETQLENGFKKL